MPLFSKSHKNPAEIVKILKENMAILEKQEKKQTRYEVSTVAVASKQNSLETFWFKASSSVC
uniref:Uncharacterized protein n=1 Tax=Meleagris gallopavo TaxID=9103 RepID=A0A803XT13_MELGA